MIKKIKLALAEDHQLVRQGMIALLKEEEGLNILFDVSNGKELMDKLKNSKPDIILMDIAMPIMNGREALEKITQKYPKINVIIITSHYSDKYIAEFITRGAKGFLPKHCDIEKVVDAIYSVHAQGYYFDPTVSRSIVEKLVMSENARIFPSDTLLSEKEIEILRLVCMEKTNQEISDVVFLSKRTVEWHKNNILEKTNSKSVISLVRYAIKNGILDAINDDEDFESHSITA
jgi:DNA-binding NarL/FixJ family response regulator